MNFEKKHGTVNLPPVIRFYHLFVIKDFQSIFRDGLKQVAERKICYQEILTEWLTCFRFLKDWKVICLYCACCVSSSTHSKI